MGKVLVALPCLNEASTISDVISAVRLKMNQANHDFDILVVDDGSTDESVQIARQLGANVISHPVNLGVGASFRSARDYCLEHGFDYLATIDSDNQFDALDMAEMVKVCSSKRLDLLTGTRFSGGASPENIPAAKLWGNRVLARFISAASGQEISDVSCGLRVYSSLLLGSMASFSKFTYTQETLLEAAYLKRAIGEYPVRVNYFENRVSRVAPNVLTYALRAGVVLMRALIVFQPVRFFLWLGSISLAASTALAVLFILNSLRDGMFSGNLWAGFLSAFLAMAGLLCVTVASISSGLQRLALQNMSLGRFYFGKIRVKQLSKDPQ